MVRQQSPTSKDWTPFGTPRTAIGGPATPTGIDTRISYAGMPVTAISGTHLTRDRIYNPTTARWTATDPLTPPIGDGYDSTYTYVTNRPGVLVDPLGQSACDHMGGLCDSPAFAWNEVVGAGQAAYGLAEAFVHPVRSYNEMVNGCNEGFDQWSGGTGMSWEGAAQCADNLNPIAGIRSDLNVSVNACSTSESGQAFGNGLFTAGAITSGFSGKVTGVPTFRAAWEEGRLNPDRGSWGTGDGASKGTPKSSPKFKSPTNAPQLPPMRFRWVGWCA